MGLFKKKKKEIKVENNVVAEETKKEIENPTTEIEETPSTDTKEVVETKKSNAKKNYHISKRAEDGKWQVKFANGQKAIKLFDTQAQAIEYAKSLAESQDGLITIHKVDGKIRKQDYSKK